MNATLLNRVCAVVNDRLFVIGGQEGDFMPKPGSPSFKCSRRNEVYQLIVLFPLGRIIGLTFSRFESVSGMPTNSL